MSYQERVTLMFELVLKMIKINQRNNNGESLQAQFKQT